MALRSAVVGAGVISRQHLTGLQECPRTELTAVCDVTEERAREAAGQYSITPYFDLEKMLASESLDWLHVCTPVQSHLSIATKAIESGVPVLIEKPVTRTVSEFEQLVTVAQESNVRFAVVHNHLYDPVMRKAQDWISQGRVGSIRGVDLLYSGLTPPDAQHRGSWVFDLPGGEFTEGLSHPLYLAIESAGPPVSRDSVSTQTSLFDSYEQAFLYDGAQVHYTTESGTFCSIMMHTGTIPQRLLRIHGESNTLIIDFVSQTLTSLSRDYTGSKVGAVLNSTDRISGRTKDTIRNFSSYAEKMYKNDWESKRNLNSHYYLFDVEAQAIQRGEKLGELTRERWTVTLLELIDTVTSPNIRQDPDEDVINDVPTGPHEGNATKKVQTDYASEDSI